MFFSESAPLKNEFAELYSSLFRNAPIYMKIVGALARKKIGMTRSELAAAAGMSQSGLLTDAPYALDKDAAADLAVKVETFRAVSKTRKAIHLTMVTAAGLVHNAYRNQIQSEVSLDDLF